MKFKLSNYTFYEKDNDIKGDFKIVEEKLSYFDEDRNITHHYTDYYVILDTIDDLVKFIQLNGTIYITDDHKLGYGNFYIE
jgi:hypothetical protein